MWWATAVARKKRSGRKIVNGGSENGQRTRGSDAETRSCVGRESSESIADKAGSLLSSLVGRSDNMRRRCSSAVTELHCGGSAVGHCVAFLEPRESLGPRCHRAKKPNLPLKFLQSLGNRHCTASCFAMNVSSLDVIEIACASSQTAFLSFSIPCDKFCSKLQYNAKSS